MVVLLGVSPLRFRKTNWSIQVGGGKVRKFKSLSSMAEWLRFNPVPTDKLVVITRNKRKIYDGFWY